MSCISSFIILTGGWFLRVMETCLTVYCLIGPPIVRSLILSGPTPLGSLLEREDYLKPIWQHLHFCDRMSLFAVSRDIRNLSIPLISKVILYVPASPQDALEYSRLSWLPEDGLSLLANEGVELRVEEYMPASMGGPAGPHDLALYTLLASLSCSPHGNVFHYIRKLTLDMPGLVVAEAAAGLLNGLCWQTSKLKSLELLKCQLHPHTFRMLTLGPLEELGVCNDNTDEFGPNLSYPGMLGRGNLLLTTKLQSLTLHGLDGEVLKKDMLSLSCLCPLLSRLDLDSTLKDGAVEAILANLTHLTSLCTYSLEPQSDLSQQPCSWKHLVICGPMTPRALSWIPLRGITEPLFDSDMHGHALVLDLASSPSRPSRPGVTPPAMEAAVANLLSCPALSHHIELVIKKVNFLEPELLRPLEQLATRPNAYLEVYLDQYASFWGHQEEGTAPLKALQSVLGSVTRILTVINRGEYLWGALELLCQPNSFPLLEILDVQRVLDVDVDTLKALLADRPHLFRLSLGVVEMSEEDIEQAMPQFEEVTKHQLDELDIYNVDDQ